MTQVCDGGASISRGPHLDASLVRADTHIYSAWFWKKSAVPRLGLGPSLKAQMDARWNVRMYVHTEPFLCENLLRTDALTRTCFLHADAFAHRSLFSQSFGIQNPLRTETFTRGHIHTEVFSTRTLLHTAAFTDKTQKLFHTEASTHSSCYTQKLFCTDAFTYGSFFRHRAAVATEAFIHTRWALLNKEALPQTFLHAEAFAHGSFYTQTFAYRSFCSQNLFHRCFYTFLHTDAFYTAAKSYRNQHRTYRIFFNNAKQTLLHTKIAHTDTLTQNRFYTQELLNRASGAFFFQTAKSQFYVILSHLNLISCERVTFLVGTTSSLQP